jgi:hypothetical protein
LQPDNSKSILNVYRNPIQKGKKKGEKDILELLGKKLTITITRTSYATGGEGWAEKKIGQNETGFVRYEDGFEIGRLGKGKLVSG